MFDVSIASGIAVVLLSLPGFWLLVRGEWERSGAGLFLLSPACVFYVAYLASFALRPPFQIAGTLQYDFTVPADTVLFLAQATSLLTWYGFVIAYRLTPSEGVQALLMRGDDRVARDIRLRASAAYFVSLAGSIAFMLSLPQLGELSLQGFGNFRANYLNSLSGAGHLYLFNLIAGTSLLLGLVFSSFCQRPARGPAIVAWGAYLIPNAIVTNRYLISAVLFALLFVAALKHVRRGGRISLLMVVVALILLAAVGTVLGLVRDFSAVPGTEHEAERRNPLVFFLWSFDMSEFYHTALHNIRTFDLGWSWVEDLFLVYLPRALFPWKPTIYGAVRIEAQAMPGSIPPDGIMSATYPISMFGEAYANFGIPGLFLVGLGIGMILKLVFYGALKAGLISQRPFWPLACFCLFVLACANALGYMRSFGWFLSMLLFHGVVFACCYFAVWVITQLCVGAIVGASRPTAAGAAPGE
jgi:hypothetical protein